MSDETTTGSGGTSTAPVYLRLQKRAETESRRPRTNKEGVVFRSLSIAFLVLVCLACSAWIIARYLDSSPRFQLRAVEVRSATFVAPSKVEAVFARDHERSIYNIPLEERRQQIEQIPWVYEAVVTRVLPDRISVAVRERQPVAFLWTRRGVMLVDGEGVILETPPKVEWSFPVLRGVSDREPVEKRREKLERYAALVEALRGEDGALPKEVSEVDLTNAQNTIVVVADSVGALKLHLGKDGLRERWSVFRSNIEEWRQQFAEIQSIDLRYEGQAVIQAANPVTLALPSNAAVPAAPQGERTAQPATPAADTLSAASL